MVDLLTVSSSVSKSVRLKAFCKPDIVVKINSLTEVGFMPLFNNFSSKLFILLLSVFVTEFKSIVKLEMFFCISIVISFDRLKFSNKY